MRLRSTPPFDKKPSGLMAVFGSAGFTIVAASLLGSLLGHWLDGLLKTSPVLMILLLLAGFMAAVLNVYFRAKQNKRQGDR